MIFSACLYVLVGHIFARRLARHRAADWWYALLVTAWPILAVTFILRFCWRFPAAWRRVRRSR